MQETFLGNCIDLRVFLFIGENFLLGFGRMNKKTPDGLGVETSTDEKGAYCGMQDCEIGHK